MVKPVEFKCSFLLMMSTTFVNKIKSLYFCVNKGYLIKWGIILVIRSSIFVTRYTQIFLLILVPEVVTDPTLKNFCIWYKILISLTCKFISKLAETLKLKLVRLLIIILKQDSASEKPVTQLGSKLSPPSIGAPLAHSVSLASLGKTLSFKVRASCLRTAGCQKFDLILKKTLCLIIVKAVLKKDFSAPSVQRPI